MNAPRLRSAAGLTLLELVATMAILGLVFGAGIGILTSMDLTSQSAPGLVRTALSAVAAAAKRESAPARLDIDAEGRRLRVIAPRTVGTWHFERSDGRGGRDLVASSFGALDIEDGHVGRALSFSGASDDAYVEFGLAAGAAIDPTEGFAIDLAVRREGDGAGRVVDLAGVAGLDVLRDGGLRGWLRAGRVDESGRVVEGTRRDVEAPVGTLEPMRWTRVSVIYDRVELRLVVDGFPAGIVAETAPVAPARGPLVLGGKPRPFPGSVDTLVVRAMEVGEPLELPSTARWPASGPRFVRFEADGALDRARHPNGLSVQLELDSGESAPVTVTPYGAVQ